ncbi:hypothetical protein BZA05DRAFT_455637, partial [Tricharina praecox]|uniref:uncharacterized protein n=1 Tax=Tricharina praecox TaxID=43433 RepID=UPI00221F8AE0
TAFAPGQLPLGERKTYPPPPLRPLQGNPTSTATMPFTGSIPRRPTELRLTINDIRVAPAIDMTYKPSKLVADFSALFKKHYFSSSGHPIIFKLQYTAASGQGLRRIPVPFSALATSSDTRTSWAEMKTEITHFESRSEAHTANPATRRWLLIICFRACKCLGFEGYQVALKMPLILGGKVVDLTELDELEFIRTVLNRTPMGGQPIPSPPVFAGSLVRRAPVANGNGAHNGNGTHIGNGTRNGNGTHHGSDGDVFMSDR